MVFEATYLVAVLTPGHMSACCGQNGAQISKVLRPNNRSNGRFICLFMTVPMNIVGIWSLPPAIREAATGIFLWPASGLYDTIKGDEFECNNFSHDWVPPTSGLRSACLVQSRETTSQMPCPGIVIPPVGRGPYTCVKNAQLGSMRMVSRIRPQFRHTHATAFR